MKKRWLIIFIIIVIVIFILFLINHKKKSYDLDRSEVVSGKVLSVSNDDFTIMDKSNLIYTFKNSDRNLIIEVGKDYEFNYKGSLDKNTCVQSVKILQVTKLEEESILFDNGMFKEFYKMAYNKLKDMTLEEKIGQVLLVGAPESNQIETIEKNNYSGYILYKRDFDGKTKTQIISHINNLQKASKIPLLIAVDEEGGPVIRVSSNSNLVSEPFKSSMELYSLGGMELIKEDTINKSKILSELGINLNLAPVVDISTDKSSYIYPRTIGQNTSITSEFAKTVIEASKNTGVSYTLKHFPGYSNNKDTHESVSFDSRTYDEILKNDLPPFIEGVNAGAEAVLVGHNIVNILDADLQASLSPAVHNLLVNEVGFTGISITDDLSMAGIGSDNNALTKALLAGNDLLIVTDSEGSIQKLLSAVNDGTLEESIIDRAALRVLAWKYYKGLFLDYQK